MATGFPGAYPKNIWGETPHTSMANQITALIKSAGGADYITAHTVVGESGQGFKGSITGASQPNFCVSFQTEVKQLILSKTKVILSTGQRI